MAMRQHSNWWFLLLIPAAVVLAVASWFVILFVGMVCIAIQFRPFGHEIAQKVAPFVREMEQFQRALERFWRDFEAGDDDAAYNAASDTFRRRVSRDEFACRSEQFRSLMHATHTSDEVTRESANRAADELFQRMVHGEVPTELEGVCLNGSGVYVHVYMRFVGEGDRVKLDELTVEEYEPLPPPRPIEPEARAVQGHE